MPIISGGTGGGAISGVVVTGTATAGQVPVASSAIAGTWANPPGFEFGYDQITSTVNITGTAENAATTVITCAAHTFDGGAVIATFCGVLKSPGQAAGDFILVGLFESTTIISRLAIMDTSVAVPFTATITGSFRFTPTAASHSYTVQSWITDTVGTPAVVAGVGGSGVNSPAYVRFTKA